MRFSKISITKKSVDLTRESKNANGALEEVHLNSPERPMASFVDVLQGFRAYVVELLPLKLTEEQLTITTLNLSEDKNGSRGLIVTATMPVPKAYDKPLVLNTPLVREGGENTSADAFVLSDEVLELIGLAEQEAARYVNGERVQLELMPKAETTSENTKALSDAHGRGGSRLDAEAARGEEGSRVHPGCRRRRESGRHDARR
jgi:hypothetical protein